MCIINKRRNTLKSSYHGKAIATKVHYGNGILLLLQINNPARTTNKVGVFYLLKLYHELKLEYSIESVLTPTNAKWEAYISAAATELLELALTCQGVTQHV